ncbi:uncharacterized protein V1518DRAFT_118235 [Limtongia smithiae]|uniref:uncharacterized protein n=1 Tax=Limtongia smithiae TaxID=1125753 RepID=UPI0034CF60EB
MDPTTASSSASLFASSATGARSDSYDASSSTLLPADFHRIFYAASGRPGPIYISALDDGILTADESPDPSLCRRLYIAAFDTYVGAIFRLGFDGRRVCTITDERCHHHVHRNPKDDTSLRIEFANYMRVKLNPSYRVRHRSSSTPSLLPPSPTASVRPGMSRSVSEAPSCISQVSQASSHSGRHISFSSAYEFEFWGMRFVWRGVRAHKSPVASVHNENGVSGANSFDLQMISRLLPTSAKHTVVAHLEREPSQPEMWKLSLEDLSITAPDFASAAEVFVATAMILIQREALAYRLLPIKDAYVGKRLAVGFYVGKMRIQMELMPWKVLTEECVALFRPKLRSRDSSARTSRSSAY